MNRIHITPQNTVEPVAGTVLLGLHRDHNYGSVLFIARRDDHNTLCFQINKPLPQTLDELMDEIPDEPALSVYQGGTEHMDHLHLFSNGQIPGGDAVGPVMWGGSFRDLREQIMLDEIDTRGIKLVVGYIDFSNANLRQQMERGAYVCVEANQRQILAMRDPFKVLAQKLGLFGAIILNSPAEAAAN